MRRSTPFCPGTSAHTGRCELPLSSWSTNEVWAVNDWVQNEKTRCARVGMIDDEEGGRRARPNLNQCGHNAKEASVHKVRINIVDAWAGDHSAVGLGSWPGLPLATILLVHKPIRDTQPRYIRRRIMRVFLLPVFLAPLVAAWDSIPDSDSNRRLDRSFQIPSPPAPSNSSKAAKQLAESTSYTLLNYVTPDYDEVKVKRVVIQLHGLGK